MLFTAEGAVVESAHYPLGVKRVGRGEHRACFERMTSAWRQRHGPIPALLAGMIGSPTGWHEAPYVDCPASLREFHRSMVSIPDVDRVWVAPGIARRGERNDVLRGEEIQLLGLPCTGCTSDFVCISGTHSKWIRLETDVVRDIHTAMTGEIFEAILEHTLFSLLVSAPAGQTMN